MTGRRAAIRSWLVAALVMLPAALSAQTPPGQAPATAPASNPAGTVSLAVLDFEAMVADADNKQLGVQLSDLLSAQLSLDASLEIVDRQDLKKVLEEKKLIMSGLMQTDQAAGAAKLIGAQLLVMGKAFTLEGRITIVARAVGSQTSLYKGVTRTAEPNASLVQTIAELGTELAALIHKESPSLLPQAGSLEPGLEGILASLGDSPRPTVAVIVPETHATRGVMGSTAEAEIRRALLDCRFKVLAVDQGELGGWPLDALQGKELPWPRAIEHADFAVVGRSSSEFVSRSGEIVTSAGQVDVRVLDRRTGKPVVSLHRLARAADLTEANAGKTALQSASRKVGVAICRAMADITLAAKPAATMTTGHGRVGESK